MNLYKLHTNKEELLGYSNRIKIPLFAWKRYKKTKDKKLLSSFINEPEFAFKYARSKNKRMKKLEPIIMRSPEFAYMYAIDILSRPWKEAEQYISKSSHWAKAYNRLFNTNI